MKYRGNRWNRSTDRLSTGSSIARLASQRSVSVGVICATALLAFGCGSDSNSPSQKRTDDTDWELPELSAEEGFSLRVPTFEVPAGHEEQSCFFLPVPDLNDGEDFWVNRVSMAMNEGSHHMNIFRVRTLIGLRPEDGEPVKMGPYDATVIRGHDDYGNSPCWQSANWGDWPLVANTEVPRPPDWNLPDGVAMRFTPGEMLMVQTHYVNTEVQPTPSGTGKVGINLHRTDQTDIQELATLFATQQNIRICRADPIPLYSGTCKFPGNVTITAANGHFHSRGKTFSMFTWDGMSTDHPPDDDRFYVSHSWNHPPMATNIERPVPDGGGIWWDCFYQWKAPLFGCDTVDAKDPEKAGDCCYTFGGNTDVGEHCNVFLYYYPKVADTDVFCN